MAANPIVKLNVSQSVAPSPSTLQQTGAMVSQGGTNLAAGTAALLTQLEDLEPLLANGMAIASMLLSAGILQVTTAAPHGLPNGSTQPVLLTAVVPSGYNGTYQAIITGPSTFNLPVAQSLGLVSSTGFFIPAVDEAYEIVQMATTYFAMGMAQAVWVFETGPVANQAAGVAALLAFVTANPSTYYAMTVPREWANEPAFLAFCTTEEALTAKTYFYVTVTETNYVNFTAQMKCVVMVCEATKFIQLPTTEFSAAAFLYVLLAYAPSAIARVTPYCFSFLAAVTPYQVRGNGPQLTAFKAANVNYVATGVEGGISNAMIYPGVTADGRGLLYWYSVDWVEINVDLDLANEVINGSNNPLAPLDYDQAGINRLQVRAQGTMTRGITYGLVNSSTAPVVTATPFAAYVNANPDDYKAGLYNGLAVSFTPTQGFTQLTFNANVSDFPTA